MKKYISILTLVAGLNLSQAQEITDALRFSQNDMNGTARFRAMGGAFGALGGDLSAISVNPASSSIFANNQFSGTLNLNNFSTETNFFGKNFAEKNSDLNINQAGAVFVFENNSEKTDWNKFAVAVNYENLNNFNSNLLYSGTNNNSIGEYFKEYANLKGGISVNDLSIPFGSSLTDVYSSYNFEDQQALLGFQAYIIDIDDDYNEITRREYKSLVATAPDGTGNYYQKNDIINTGYNGKLGFNASAQYQEKLTIGLNLNTHFTDYTRSSRFYESNTNNTGTTNLVNKVYFNNDLHTFGNGFSFQVGGIYKISSIFRLGLAYESPTWLKLEDELSQSVVATSGNPTDGDLVSDEVNPNITIIYGPYTLQTPDKWTLSGALVFGKDGLISFDYSKKNYSSMHYKPSENYDELNSEIKTVFTNANEYRIGLEKKLKQWSLRGGYRFEESPYKDKTKMGDLTGFSGGLGYNFGSTKLDFAYSNAKRSYADQMFSKGLTDKAFLNSKNNNFTVTLAFEL